MANKNQRIHEKLDKITPNIRSKTVLCDWKERQIVLDVMLELNMNCCAGW